jgi:D-3-phosphoglycerate dehydrogenase / 2-oxoglutarate reductase
MLVEVPRPRFSGALLEAADIAIDHTALSTEVARKCAGPKHVVFLDTGARSYINPEELAALKISVPLIKGYGDTAVAESTIALMWASARVLAQLERDMRPGKWPREDGMQTLGLIGFGGIAAEVARMALGRGMRVIVWNRRARSNALMESPALLLPNTQKSAPLFNLWREAGLRSLFLVPHDSPRTAASTIEAVCSRQPRQP